VVVPVCTPLGVTPVLLHSLVSPQAAQHQALTGVKAQERGNGGDDIRRPAQPDNDGRLGVFRYGCGLG